MGLFDTLSDLVAAAAPWSTVEAEAVSGGTSQEKTPAQKHESGEGEAQDPDAPTPDDKSGGGPPQVSGKEASGNPSGKTDAKDDEEEQPEEEEDEEELVDPKEKFEEECKESKACAPAKHHFDECVERVTAADDGKPVEKKHPHEDCVEEFFHLAHCANQCAAPKVWASLK